VSRTLGQWLALQEAAHPKAIDLDLARVGAVARGLGLERPRAAVITVGGTNGKGSTVAHLEALLLAAGRTVGLFTSPHLLRYNERIRVDGVEVADPELIEAFERIEAARGATTLTFFEYSTLAALAIFARRGVEFALLEVGLGGRLDATNLIDADVAVLCSVGLDHRDYLGETLDEIGAEKAGIFRRGRAAVLGTAAMPASVYSAIERIGAEAVIAERDFSFRIGPGGRWSFRGRGVTLADLPPSALTGAVQYRNAATALAALAALGDAGAPGRARVDLDARTVTAALARVRLPGRFQVVPGPIEWILDIAHNAPAAEVLAGELHARPCAGRTLAVAGILADKDAAAMAAALAPVIDVWVLCTLAGPRGRTAAELAARLAPQVANPVLASSVTEGCAAARAMAQAGDRVVVFGSFHTVGPALEWLGVYSSR
jgi:dihydrofolate synthase/folylpolyglutamate synthase